MRTDETRSIPRLVLAGLALVALAACSGGTGDESPSACDHDGDGVSGPQCYGSDCDDEQREIGACGCGEQCVAGACVFTACDGKACGPDGCGGACGYWTECGKTCVDGDYVFSACEGRSCGDDGCGGQCGPPCGIGLRCDGTCVCDEFSCGGECIDSACVCGPDTCGGDCTLRCEATWGECIEDACRCSPTCNGKTCGDDGCGGACGACAHGETCGAGSCASFDPAEWTAIAFDSMVSERYFESDRPGDVGYDHPCCFDINADGACDEVYGNPDGDTDPWSSSITRLLLLPAEATEPFDAVLAWASTSATGETNIATEAAYGRPAPYSLLPDATFEGGRFTTNANDLQAFDTSMMREGAAPSWYNAMWLVLSYTPVREARLSGTLTPYTDGGTDFEGYLGGLIRRADVEYAIWLALAHCSESEYGSGTCAQLADFLNLLDDFVGWTLPPGNTYPDGAVASVCARITGRDTTIAGVEAAR